MKHIFSYCQNKMTKQQALAWALCFLLPLPGTDRRAAPEKDKKKEDAPLTQKPAAAKLEKAQLTVDEAIKVVLENNLDLKEAKFSILMSDSALRRSRKKYAWTLNGGASRSRMEIPDVGSNQTFQGKDSTTTSLDAGIQKTFRTGTTVGVGITHSLTERTAGDPISFPTGPNSSTTFETITPKSITSKLNFTLSQELLKNYFGVNDRRQEAIYENQAKIQQAQLFDMLTNLVVTTIIDYWSLTTAEENLETAKIQLDNAILIRNILIRKRRRGLAEAFEVSQYNAQVANAESSLEMARQKLEDARTKILRTMNLAPGTEIKGVTVLTEKLPEELDPKDAFATAMKNRWDMQVIRLELENARLQKDIAENNSMPSLRLEGTLSSKGEDADSRSTTLGDATTFGYVDYNVGVRVTYPLWDEEVQTARRDANLTQRSKRVALQKIKDKVRAEIEIGLRDIKTKHKILRNAIRARDQSYNQYAGLQREFRKGRFNVTQVTTAYNGYINSRYQVVNARIQYNMALLKFDLARNTLFLKYGIDVNHYIQKFQDELRKEEGLAAADEKPQVEPPSAKKEEEEKQPEKPADEKAPAEKKAKDKEE